MRRNDLKFYIIVCGLVLVIFLAYRSSRPVANDELKLKARSKLQIFLKRKPGNCPDTEKDLLKHTTDFSVSVIVYTDPNHKHSILSQTVNSVIAYSDPSILKEVIIANNGGLTEDHLKLIKDEYSSYDPLVKLMTSQSTSRLKTKLLIGHAAVGDVIVFIDDTIVVSPGYLPPLLAALKGNKEKIAVPSFNYLSEETLMEETHHEESKWVFDWNLNLVSFEISFQEMASKSESEYFPTVVFDSSAFALHKSYLEKLGQLKHEMEYLGSIDLSFASWLCGQGAWIIPCSRVGKIGFQATIQEGTPKEKNLVATHYMTDRYFRQFKRLNTEISEWSEAEQQRLNINAKIHKKQCPNDFNWLMENIAQSDVFVPSDDALAYGTFELNGLCFKQNAAMIFLGSKCTFQKAGSMIEYLKTGQLRMGKECLRISDKGYIVSDVCDYNSESCKWEWTQFGQFQQKDGKNLNCISHSTDPYPEENHRQVLMYTACATDSSHSNLVFQKWSSFIRLK